MICPQCGKDNPEGMQQCASCGAALAGAYLPPRTSGLAVASLVLSVLCAPVGLVLAIVALSQISSRRDQLTGSGFAIAGIVVSAVMFLGGVLAAMLFPVVSRARERARMTQCLSNVKSITLGLNMYLTDWDAYPVQADRWGEVLDEYVKNQQVFVCPSYPNSRSGYAFMGELAGEAVMRIEDPQKQVAIFESDRGWDAFGDLSLLPAGPRHLGGDNYGFVDGHAKWYSRTSPPGGPATIPGGGSRAPAGSGSGY